MKNDLDKFEEFGPEAFELEAEEKTESPFWKFIIRGVSLVVILGLLYIFGFQNLFLYRTTPAVVEQEEVEKKVDAEILSIPLNIIVLTTSEDGYGSKRGRESVERLVLNADRVWEQAGIDLDIKGIHYEEKNDALLRSLYQNPKVVIDSLQNFREGNINVLLVGSLGGINGVSFGGLRTVAVADYTTVYDFRALAHEIGHQLGLIHVNETRGQLMYQGANGFNLSIEEIEIARDLATFFSTSF